MRLIGIDYGTKRVGVASTDESGEFALPRAVLPNDASLVEKIVEMCRDQGINRIVLGESKNFDAADNPVQHHIQIFKKVLEEKGLDVVLHPEILTSREARQLQGNTEMTDASAASLILKSYIDSQKS